MPDGSLREYALIPEFAENPVIPEAPTSVEPEEESSNTNASPEPGYVLSAESRPQDEAAGPLNTADETPRVLLAPAPVKGLDEIVVPEAEKLPPRRLKRKRSVSPESE